MNTCRICSCSDADCTWCMVLTGEPCSWAELDLCSACAGMGANDEKRAKKRSRIAWDKGYHRGANVPGKAELLDHATKMLRVWARHNIRRMRCKVVSS